jgi:hypothetical protein
LGSYFVEKAQGEEGEPSWRRLKEKKVSLRGI